MGDLLNEELIKTKHKIKKKNTKIDSNKINPRIEAFS